MHVLADAIWVTEPVAQRKPIRLTLGGPIAVTSTVAIASSITSAIAGGIAGGATTVALKGAPDAEQ